MPELAICERVEVGGEPHHFRHSDGSGTIAPAWHVDIHDNGSSPRIFADLDADLLEERSKPTVCTATVRFAGNKTAVVHFSVGVRDGKVTAELETVAEKNKRTTRRQVSVPKWVRTHVRGKQ